MNFGSSTGKSRNRQPRLLGRKQEIDLQLNQVIDAVLLVLSLWAAHTIRWFIGESFPIIPAIEAFKVYTWLIVIIMPFGPLFLDLNGFYHFPLQKRVLKSIGQIGPALLWLGVLIAACTVFFRFNVNSRSVLVFRSTPDVSWSLLIKRSVDLVCASIGLILLAPLMLIVALLIRVTSPGPAIFTQRRCGKHGEPFKMFKFRSMYSDAEQRRHELEEYNQMSGPVFKLDDDPRITPLGRWLRRYSIDELPQLFNVLGGQMSLVGPRPLPTYEVENFANPAQRRRLSVKPGITCLWQISGRNEVRDFETWVKLDLDYIDDWSIWLDFQILVLTLPAVLGGSGAR
jgi:lipopolysaccharide/colanic/teichoic acid biosynthesis glycosyltransferase